MRDILTKVLAGAGAWAELRWHRRSQLRITVEKGEVRQAKVDAYQGVGARVLAGGSWGFSSTSSAEPAAIARAMAEAESIARFLAPARQEQARLPGLAAAVREHVDAPRDPVTAHSIEEKLQLALEAERATRSRSPLIASATASYTEYVDEKWIANSSGVIVHEVNHKPEFGIWAVASRDDQKSYGSRHVGISGGWSDLLAKARPDEIAEHAAKLSVDKLSAPYPEGGVFTVVMDPELVGLLCHEAIGHTVEADFVLSGSVAGDRLGQKVAGDMVTMCDSGASEIEPLAAGSIACDDEGTPARRVVLIENGVLRGYLHNLETAARFGVEPTGNARAWEYDGEPLIRMRNTYIEPGRQSPEELIAGIEDGYWVRGAGGGQADANAEFMFGADETYRVRKGKVVGLCREATLSGQAFDVLKSVDGLGDDFEWAMGSGYCGKGQPAKVDGGGPSIRCRVTVAGQQE